MTPRVSVVVPTYRRPALLERCLDALSRQDLGSGEFEIVVVHDGPSETAPARVAAVKARLAARGVPLAYVECEHGGPAAARNVGWRAAAAPLIAFTDDDTVPDSRWLGVALEALDADPGAGAASGGLVMPLPADPTDYEIDAARLADSPFVTANCFCRKEVLEAVGGFDERFEIAWREDSDLHFRLLEHGARVIHVPNAIVVHPVRPARWGVSLAQQRKVLYDALLFKKHRKLYRERIRGRPRLDYYAIVLALAATAAAAAAGATAVASASAALWLLLTGRLALKRLRPATKRLPHVAEMALTSLLIPPLAVLWRLIGALRFRVLFL